MNPETVEMYIEAINGILGICIFLVTLFIFKFTSKNPDFIKKYFFLETGKFSRPFFYLMVGMLIWGLREFYKFFELRDLIHIGLFYEISEFFSALSLFIGMLYFLKMMQKR